MIMISVFRADLNASISSFKYIQLHSPTLRTSPSKIENIIADISNPKVMRIAPAYLLSFINCPQTAARMHNLDILSTARCISPPKQVCLVQAPLPHPSKQFRSPTIPQLTIKPFDKFRRSVQMHMQFLFLQITQEALRLY